MAAVGYIRVSTADPNADLQRDALKAAGVDRIFEDLGVSGSTASRPGLDAALDFLREDDILVVWRLDRLGRSTVNVLSLLDELAARQVGFRSLTEGLDTGGSMGRVLISIMAAFAQLERDVIRERTSAGLKAARDRGRVGGRPRSLNDSTVAVARALFATGKPATVIAGELGCSVATVYRALSPAVG
jgi:DNA invertase Pin-like site-specific DNA recombinase